MKANAVPGNRAPVPAALLPARLHFDIRDTRDLLAPEQIRNLSLGRTQVTDEGLVALADCPNLVWLDLSRTSVGDAGLAHV